MKEKNINFEHAILNLYRNTRGTVTEHFLSNLHLMLSQQSAKI